MKLAIADPPYPPNLLASVRATGHGAPLRATRWYAGKETHTRGGIVRDVLSCGVSGAGFAGAKPAAWTRWILDALGYDHDTDTVDDLFPGSGAVSAAIAQGVLL